MLAFLLLLLWRQARTERREVPTVPVSCIGHTRTNAKTTRTICFFSRVVEDGEDVGAIIGSFVRSRSLVVHQKNKEGRKESSFSVVPPFSVL